MQAQRATSWYSSFSRKPTEVAVNPIEYILIRGGAFVIGCGFFSFLIYGNVPPVPTPTTSPVPKPTTPPAPTKISSEDFCKNNECCNNQWLIQDLSGLEKELNEKVFGQHLVNKLVGKAVNSHIKNKDSKSPLVMSFHGWTGTGKTFVSQIVANSLFKKGINSKFVYQKIVTKDFPHNFHLEKYKIELNEYIKTNIGKCERTLFIFDEFEKMPEGLANVMTPYLENQINSQDYRKSIFIFLSNTAGDKINLFTSNHYTSRKSRETISPDEMEKIISDALKSSFEDSIIIKNSLIDFYVPFLPLEREHVKQCAKAELERNNFEYEASTLDDIADEMHYFPNKEQWFSSTGCKTIAKKVGILSEH
ncbi:torsin-1A isoform X2 [Hydra vulgaris]|uniref:torsin-1A isoform X2 n=1 Tax=Hydra vulgaris TaxID=6087 RepID=UPI001F5F3654|nr:torsin-1A isoform X2 [Hydra vulgaris]